MNVDTTNYQDTHGKAPRGEGTWMFDLGRNGAWTTIFTPFAMRFSDAKKWAIREAHALGADRLQVAP